MKPCCFILLLLATCVGRAERIDSLKAALALTNDTARIDLLNQIGREYMLLANYDSANHYQYLACTSSENLQYTHGLADAFAIKGEIERYIFDNFPAAEAYLKLAESLYDKTPDKRNIELVYDGIWHCLNAQSKFKEAREYVLKRIKWCKQHDNPRCIGDMYLVLTSHYIEMGQFDQAFDHVRMAFAQANFFESSDWLQAEQGFPAKIYMTLGDYERALEGYRVTFNHIMRNRKNEIDPIKAEMWITTELAETYALLGKFDSAFLCYSLIDTIVKDWKDFRVYLVSLGEVLLMQNKYKQALVCFQRALPHNRKINDRSQVIRTVLDISKSHLGLRQYQTALFYAQEALRDAKQTLARKSMMDAYELLYLSYDGLKNYDQANSFFRLYSQMKDSVASDRIKGKIAAAEYEKQLSFLTQEKIIIQQGLQLEKQRVEKSNLVSKFLIVGIILILLLAGVLFRNFVLRRTRLERDLEIQKLESKRIAMEMREKTAELETAALRAQMNPHFIFNCLNAINHFILNNDADLASEYLIKFSRLIRLVLNSSSSKFITLADELATIGVYIELEQLRVRKHFDLILHTQSDIDTSRVLIPPMLIQPFVENAIWHGLMKVNNGVLKVQVCLEGSVLTCVVEDNGIGRRRSNQQKTNSSSYKKSMGIEITHDRLKLLFADSSNSKPFLHVADLYDDHGRACGTRVTINIPVRIAENMINEKKSAT